MFEIIGKEDLNTSACWSPANLFEVALLVGSLLGVLVVDDVQRRLPLLQLQALDLRLQLVELLLQVFALLHVLHPEGDGGKGYKGSQSIVAAARNDSVS